MKNNSITALSHLLLSANITNLDVVIDATMGNGYDTAFLAQNSKFVYAFDIQKSALDATKIKLDKLRLTNVSLILDSHENIKDYVKDFKGVLYNLGYLPHSDKKITTTSKTTINSLIKTLPLLRKSCFILLVVYPKHKEGYLESLALDELLATLDAKVYKILKISLPFQDNRPPYIIFIQKEKDEALV